MTVALQFTPLYGAQSDDPLCCLLRIGSASILLDCGWNEQFDVQLLQPVLKVLPQVGLVLLSQPDAQHLGALPYLVGKAGLKAPIYAAAPIAKLGPMFMYDYHTSLHAVSDFNVFGPEDVDAAFDALKTLKHHQLLELDVQGTRLRLVGYPAGHMVGGTLWVIEAGGEVVVYGPYSNHMKERHLNAGQLKDVPVRPALVVAGAAWGCAQGGSRASRSTREKALEEALREVFRRGGNALLPVDSAGRMLEVLLVLDRMWQREKFPYALALLSCVSSSTLHAAGALLEWMSDELQKEFNAASINPLLCKKVDRCHSLSDVGRLPEGSKVVLATGLGLDHGLSRQLLLSWGGDSRNAVIFTQQPRAGSLGAQLLSAGSARPLNLNLTVGRRVPLTGEELQEYEAQQAAAEAAEVQAAEAIRSAADAAALLPLRESSEAISQLKRGATGNIEQVLVGQEAAFDFFGAAEVVDADVLMDGFAPPPSAMFCMFPDEQEQLQQSWDEYGAVFDTSGMRQDDVALDEGAAAADDDEVDAEDVPTKVIQEQVQLCLAASVSFIDGFAGISDPRSLATILAGIAPRSLVLLGANAADTRHLAEACNRELKAQQTQVLQPAAGQEVSLRLAASYRINIGPQMLSNLSTHTLGLYKVAWLDGVLGAAAAAAAAAEQQPTVTAAGGTGTVAEPAKQQWQPKIRPEDREQLLTLLPPNVAAAAAAEAAAPAAMDLDRVGSVVVFGSEEAVDHAAGAAENGTAAEAAAARTAAEVDMVEAAVDQACGDHGGIFIGDVKLSEVKQALASKGLHSEFRAGKLVVKGVLVVRKDGPDGQLLLEGPLCSEYFEVRDVVYSLYNVC